MEVQTTFQTEFFHAINATRLRSATSNGERFFVTNATMPSVSRTAVAVSCNGAEATKKPNSKTNSFLHKPKLSPMRSSSSTNKRSPNCGQGLLAILQTSIKCDTSVLACTYDIVYGCAEVPQHIDSLNEAQKYL